MTRTAVISIRTAIAAALLSTVASLCAGADPHHRRARRARLDRSALHGDRHACRGAEARVRYAGLVGRRPGARAPSRRKLEGDNDTTWEFKLRRGVKFHDGSDFTAEDVKFSIERIPTVAGPNPTTIYVRRVKETKVVDPLTVHVVTDGRGAQPAQRLHPPVHRLLESCGRPDQGNRQRGVQLRQGRRRHRALQVRFMAAERRPRPRPQRQLLGRRRSRGRVTSARRSPTTPPASRS